MKNYSKCSYRNMSVECKKYCIYGNQGTRVKKILKILIYWWIFFSEFYSFPQQLLFIFSRKKCSLFREKGTPVQETQKCRACTYSYSNGTDILLGVKANLGSYVLRKDLSAPYKNLKNLNKRKSESRKIAQKFKQDVFRTMSKLYVKILDEFRLLTILTS